LFIKATQYKWRDRRCSGNNEVTPQALANINLKKAKNVSGPYLIMCLYTFSLLNLMKKPASVTGIKNWLLHRAKF
jgi:hypothetical protein